MLLLTRIICFISLIFQITVCYSDTTNNISHGNLTLKIDPLHGSYAIYQSASISPVISANIAAKVNHQWVYSNQYPKHIIRSSTINTLFGTAKELKVIHTGLNNQPDLICLLRLYEHIATGEIKISVVNHQPNAITIQAIRVLDSIGKVLPNWGKAQSTRVLSDTYSEDRPTLQIYDMTSAPNHLHRAVGSQLIYNRSTHQSFFIGALTSEHFLTIARLSVNHYKIDSVGTTEITKEFSLKNAPKKNQIELSLSVKPGASLSSERVIFSIGSDYHMQLQTYAHLINQLHHARVSSPTPIGWWSWTVFYRDITQSRFMENAQWLSQHLLSLGYQFFHLDDGYESARGDYTTPDIRRFPDSMINMGNQVKSLGLTFGIWTAPFEVSDRSSVYRHHKDWLVHNADGKPIGIGYINENGHDTEQLFALDTSHPQAQAYLRSTYSTLANQWGARYIKLDFMEDSTIEGYRFQPNLSALEAQRIGVKIIRDAVGDRVLLDKDGSPILNMVGYVDMGRVSVDTGHEFAKNKAAAVGIAARYFMNRNFFITDPDAFSVSRYRIEHEDPITLDEAKVSIALSAISGGMYEVGDELTQLSTQKERLKLLENQTLITMARKGQASTPIDLMDYLPEDGQPSVFLLKENSKQIILTVFNWTEGYRQHLFNLTALGLANSDHYHVSDILDPEISLMNSNSILTITQPSHSVRMLRITTSN